MSVTVHSLVANEDQFIWFSLMSVLPFIDKILIYDTGSTDKTVEIIKSIKSEKIVFEEKGKVSPTELVKLRNEQIQKTKTDFFMILDGDEIWPKVNLEKFLTGLKNMPKEKIGVYCRTRNTIGDIYHYLPESAGNYRFQNNKGHLTMRAFRNVSGLTVDGIYPLETYKYQDRSLNDWDERLFFIDTWYLHTTHLRRSSNSQKVSGFRTRKIETGIAFKKEEIPEVFLENLPPKRPFFYELAARIITPLKEIKRHYAKV